MRAAIAEGRFEDFRRSDQGTVAARRICGIIGGTEERSPMKMSGEEIIAAPIETVWKALNDPRCPEAVHSRLRKHHA
jgi:hypothetical protein